MVAAMDQAHSAPNQPTDALLDLMLSRRSATVLEAPGPTESELARILSAVGTVPDHGQLRPFRFAVVSDGGREVFGAALADAALERKPGLSEQGLQGLRAKALRSPTIIVLIASPKPGKIEAWEQLATAACSGYAIVLAAHALGVGAMWKSVPFTRGKGLTELFGLGPTEEMLGWIHLGTSKESAVARPTLDVSALTTVIDGPTPRPFSRRSE
jgi:nitroreductase